jgi:hypothetical protein
VVVLILALVVALVTAPTASGADQPLWADVGYLANPTTGLVADVEGMSTNAGAGVQLWSFHGGQNQRWQFSPRSSNPYTWEIKASHSRMCMDVEGGSRADGARVRQAPCNGGWSQAWEPFVVSRDGWGQPQYHLVNDNSHLCLQAAATTPAQGAVLYQAPCSGNRGQEWSLTHPVSNPASGRVMDVWGVSTSPGAPVWLWDYLAGRNQDWYTSPLPDGFATQLVVVHSRQCLDLEGGSTADGTALVQQPCNSARSTQRWLLEWVAWDSYRYALYRIRNTTANRCMTALGTTAGSRLIIQNCNGSAGQQWRR